MFNAGGGKREITSLEMRTIVSDGESARTLQDEVEFVLSLMNMRLVFLAGLKAVHAGRKRLTPHQIALAHLTRAEFRALQDVRDSHALYCGTLANAAQGKWLLPRDIEAEAEAGRLSKGKPAAQESALTGAAAG